MRSLVAVTFTNLATLLGVAYAAAGRGWKAWRGVHYSDVELVATDVVLC